MVLTDNKVVRGGPTNWGAGFLPASYQGTHSEATVAGPRPASAAGRRGQPAAKPS